MYGVQNISFTESKVGKRIKGSKKLYSWKLKIEKKELNIDLFVSKISHKIKLLVNNEIQFAGKHVKGTNFQSAFEFEDHKVNISQQDKKFELRVDSVLFDQINKQSKPKEEIKHVEEIKPEIKEKSSELTKLQQEISYIKGANEANSGILEKEK